VALLAAFVGLLQPFGGNPGNLPSPAALVTLLLLAPLSEEIFFRGILLKGIRENHPGWVAVTVSSLIFMGAHGSFAAGPLILGIVNGIVTLRSGSIVPGIVFHTISNLYGPAMTLLTPNLARALQFLYP
jgi:membrane protease YdiL (CAAX protease family)